MDHLYVVLKAPGASKTQGTMLFTVELVTFATQETVLQVKV